MPRTSRKTTTTAAAPAVVADICLYGTSMTGAGWIAAVNLPGAEPDDLPVAKSLGDGEPRPHRTFTEAIWQSVGAIVEARRGAGVVDAYEGDVAIYESGGKRVARVPLGNVPIYGDLATRWQPAPGLSLSADQIIAAASSSSR